MTDAIVPVQNPSVTDTSLDAEELTVSAIVVKRERVQLAGAAAAEIARVENSTPGGADYGMVTRNIPSGTQTVDSELPAALALGDSSGNPTSPAVGAFEMGWNPINSTWERVVRGLGETIILASTARTTTQTQAAQTNRGWQALYAILDVTAQAGGSITLEIQGQDPGSSKWIPLLTGTAVTTVGTTVYRVSPRLVAAANLIAQEQLWRTWRIVITANNASSITYSLGALLLA